MAYNPRFHTVRIALCLAAVIVSLSEPRLAAAQVLTGSLNGTVRDEQGLLVAGARPSGRALRR